jgi:hypothetical protein
MQERITRSDGSNANSDKSIISLVAESLRVAPLVSRVVSLSVATAPTTVARGGEEDTERNGKQDTVSEREENTHEERQERPEDATRLGKSERQIVS